MEKKVENEDFDLRTIKNIGIAIKKNVITKIIGKISQGKEASILLCESDFGYRVMKIYRIETSHFKRGRKEYINKQTKNEYELSVSYASKEFKHLMIASKVINAPTPYYQVGNIIIMEFLGRDGKPFDKLKDIENFDIDDYNTIMKMIDDLYNAGLVHGDLSEFNILYDNKKFYFIDFGQSVSSKNPKAKELLERDRQNIKNFANRFLKNL
jgi:RIO kinase 1